MNKRRLHHIWTKFRRVKPWYFLAIALFSTLICLFALRANNQHMVGLRNEVFKADRLNGDVQAALKDLQAYVTNHMNTDLSSSSGVYPPIQLKFTYERLTKAQVDQGDNDVYTRAQHHCEKQNSQDFSGRNRVPCIQAYVKAHQGKEVTQVPDALYKFSFVSPRWSPDLAGWSMLIAVLAYLLFVISFALDKWFKKHVA